MKQPPLAIRRLEVSNLCDVCGKPRSCGDNKVKHVKCSKIRQQRYAARENA